MLNISLKRGSQEKRDWSRECKVPEAEDLDPVKRTRNKKLEIQFVL